jgi:hypothetical protein
VTFLTIDPLPCPSLSLWYQSRYLSRLVITVRDKQQSSQLCQWRLLPPGLGILVALLASTDLPIPPIHASVPRITPVRRVQLFRLNALVGHIALLLVGQGLLSCVLLATKRLTRGTSLFSFSHRSSGFEWELSLFTSYCTSIRCVAPLVDLRPSLRFVTKTVATQLKVVCELDPRMDLKSPRSLATSTVPIPPVSFRTNCCA